MAMAVSLHYCKSQMEFKELRVNMVQRR